MRILELNIDRFGIWEGVSLPFSERDITVLYGPNEAGKSTLMRFVRGVLYGFPAREERSSGPRTRPERCSGSLRITHEGREYRLQRTSRPGTRGELKINGRPAADDDPLLHSITGGVSEALFQNVFAIGLKELQQLATLNGDEVAEHIYSLSLGPEGKQISRAQSAFAAEEQSLIGEEASGEGEGERGRGGEIPSLLQKLAYVDRELARTGSPRERHGRTQSRLRELEAEIDGRKRQQSQMQQNLRGHQFLGRVREPWTKERQLQRELGRLPADDVDRDLLDRFDDLELELADVEDRRKNLVDEARRLQRQARDIEVRPELEEQACAIRQLAEQSREIQAVERELRGDRSGEDPRGREVSGILSRLEGRWDLARLERADVSPAALHQLMRQANRYRSAVRSRMRIVKRYKRETASLPGLERDWKTQAGKLGAESPAEVRKILTRRLHDLEELRGLRMRQGHLRKGAQLFARYADAVASSREREDENPEGSESSGEGPGSAALPDPLPPYFWWVIGFFIASGVCLFGAGIHAAFRGYDGVVAGGATAWIVGAIYTLLGLTALGTGWTIKQHLASGEFPLGDLGAEQAALEKELARVEQAIDRLTRKDAFRPPLSETVAPKEGPQEFTEEQLIERIRRQLVELDKFERQGERIELRRRRLAKMRKALQERQRQVGRGRQEWSEALRRMELAETLKVSEAFRQCQIIAQARALLESRSTPGHSEDLRRREVESFLKKIEELAERLEGRGFRVHDPYQLVGDWDREVQLQTERRRERSRLRKTCRERGRESLKLVEKIERLRQHRAKLLSRLGVRGREEISAKLAAIEERAELEERLQSVRSEIENLTRAEPELAIVEEDLLNYEESRNRIAIEELKRKIAELDLFLQEDYETLGQVKRELREIEEDRSATSLRFDREQIVDALREATERWAAARLADRGVDQLRQRLERDRQPRMLKDASEYLLRFTCGKYHNVWTPLGERALLVDDEPGHSLRMEQLSSGTREQVFLAVRLAMIREFAARGVDVPMILDDVTVNFDQIRTEAAVETLLNVAHEGQQILLFTCHLHLAHLFESDGVEPLWLPAHRSEMPISA